MANFFDFLGGASDHLLKERTNERDSQRDIAKNKALEALRRETSDYEYNRARDDGRKQVDAKQSYLDGASKEYVMVNAEGQVVGRRAATQSELSASDLDALKIEDMRTEIAYKKKLTSNVGATSGGYGGGRRGLDSGKADTKPEKMNALASGVINNLRKYDLPQNFIVQAESYLRERIASGTVDEQWVRRFEASYLSDPRVNKSLRAQSEAKAAADIFGK